MKVIVVPNYEFLSKKAAQIFVEQINKNPKTVLGLATGSSPIGTYNELIKAFNSGVVSFSQVSTYNLDEYCGLAINHPQSYYHFMHEKLFNHIDITEENIHIPTVASENLQEECNNYDKMLNETTIDIQLLGIGGNGHIGFNEPGTSFEQETFIVKLAEETRNDNKRFFSSLEEVPTHAITMGIKNIMAARQIIMVISGKGKAGTVKRLLTGPVDEGFPASVLHLHDNVIVIVDEDAYSLMEN